MLANCAVDIESEGNLHRRLIFCLIPFILFCDTVWDINSYYAPICLFSTTTETVVV